MAAAAVEWPIREVRSEIIRQIDERSDYRYLVTCNLEHLALLRRRRGFREAYAESALVLIDGQPIRWLARIAIGRMPPRITGADLAPSLMDMARDNGWRVCIVGGTPEAKTRLDRIHNEMPAAEGFHVCHITDLIENPHELDEALVRAVRELDPNLILLCLGAPKQEFVAQQLRGYLEHGVALCCGGAIDFMAGLRPRAPQLIQRLGLEWMWRLIHEPRRLWRRYLVISIPEVFRCLWDLWSDFRDQAARNIAPQPSQSK